MAHTHFIENSDAPGPDRDLVLATDLVRYIRDAASQSDKPTKIVVRRLSVEGDVDLSGLGANGEWLPSIEFQNCAISELNFEGCACLGVALFDTDIDRFCGRGLEVRTNLTIQRVNFRENGQSPAINLYQATIHGDIYWQHVASPSSELQAVVLSEIKITGRLQILNSNIGSRVLLEGANVGTLFIYDTTVAGSLMAQGLKVSQSLSLARATIGDGLESFNSHGCEVGGPFKLSACHLKGKFRLYAGRIGINLEFKDRTLCDPDPEGTCIDLSSSTIGNAIQIGSHASFLGTIHLHYATVNGSVDINDAYLNSTASNKPSICFSDSHLGSMSITRCVFNGDLNLANIGTTGNVTIGGMRHRFDADDQARRNAQNLPQLIRRVDLSGAKIGGKVEIVDSVLETVIRDRMEISPSIPRHSAAPLVHVILDGASADAIDLPPTSEASMLLISWAGFSANRILVASSESAQRIVHRLKRDALYWARDRRQLQAQPFIHFAQHLRSAGWQDEADHLLVEMKRVQRKLQSRLAWVWSFLFDAMFLYGFGKLRSALTLLTWVLFGTLGANAAVGSDALVLSTQAVLPAVSVSQLGGDAAPAPLMIYGRPAAYSELPCRGEIVPLYYAVELVLPIFDLGQRGKCDLRGMSKQKSWFSDSIFWWWMAKYLYVMVGWIIVSMTLLTFLGTMKSRAYGSL